jgi:hypothetical protein
LRNTRPGDASATCNVIPTLCPAAQKRRRSENTESADNK